MSLILLEKEIKKNWANLNDHFKSISFDASEIIRPYSTRSEKFIYSGNEKIPFNKRDSKFQLILRKEFSNVMKE